jgi:hypothetical protein
VAYPNGHAINYKQDNLKVNFSSSHHLAQVPSRNKTFIKRIYMLAPSEKGSLIFPCKLQMKYPCDIEDGWTQFYGLIFLS